MKVNLFKLTKNKKFNYSPRYLKDKSDNNIFQFDSVYEKQKRARKITEKIQVSKEDLEELKSTSEPTVDTPQEENSDLEETDISLDKLSEAENEITEDNSENTDPTNT